MARMNRPAPVEITYKNMRFLITHNPTNATLSKFIEVRRGQRSPPPPAEPPGASSSPLSVPVCPQELKKYGVTTVVRVCEATYDAALVVKEGIQVLVSRNPRSLLEVFCLASGGKCFLGLITEKYSVIWMLQQSLKTVMRTFSVDVE